MIVDGVYLHHLWLFVDNTRWSRVRLMLVQITFFARDSELKHLHASKLPRWGCQEVPKLSVLLADLSQSHNWVPSVWLRQHGLRPSFPAQPGLIGSCYQELRQMPLTKALPSLFPFSLLIQFLFPALASDR